MSDTAINILTRLGLLGVAKGATAAAQATVTTVDADHNALDVTVKGTPALAADAATATLQGTGNGFLQTLAGIVSAGRAAVTEASAASILARFTAGRAAAASSLSAALSTEDAAKVPALGQALAAASSPVVLPTAQDVASLAVSVPDAVLPAAAMQIGGVASTAAPSAVTSGRGVRAWFSLVGAQMMGVLGANGSAIASATNGVPVVAQTSSTWDVSTNLTRALGYLTGVNLTSAAAANNPVPVQLSDGSAVFTGAKDATLTGGTQIAIAKGAAASGAAVSGNPVLVAGSDGTNARTIATDTSGRIVAVGAAATGASVSGSPVYVAGIDGGGLVRPLLVSAAGNGQVSQAKGTTVSSSAAEASRVISGSACLVAKFRMYNGNAGVRYGHMFNATSLPGNGAVPIAIIEQMASAHANEVNFPIPTDRCGTGCTVATSSTGATLTVGASDATFMVDLYPANA